MKKQSEKVNLRPLLVLLIAIVIIVAIVVIVKMVGGKTENQDPAKVESGENANNEYITVLEDGGRKNNSEKVTSTKMLEGLEISNISLTERGGITTLLADVKNSTDKESGDFTITIRLTDKDGNEILNTTGYLEKVAAGGTAQINANITADVANAYSLEITRAQ